MLDELNAPKDLRMWNALNAVAYFCFDRLDVLLGFVYRFLDWWFGHEIPAARTLYASPLDSSGISSSSSPLLGSNDGVNASSKVPGSAPGSSEVSNSGLPGSHYEWHWDWISETLIDRAPPPLIRHLLASPQQAARRVLIGHDALHLRPAPSPNGGRQRLSSKRKGAAPEELVRLRQLARDRAGRRSETWTGAERKDALEKLQRWSDCGCRSCSEWCEGDGQLYVYVDGAMSASAVRESGDSWQGLGTSSGGLPLDGAIGSEDPREEISSRGVELEEEASDVIFLHGFLSSSSFWSDTVLPYLSPKLRATSRLFAPDLLGFGRSPKPSDCYYTFADHVDAIEASVFKRYGVKSFHLVGHSMGCNLAVALAVKHMKSVRSITFIAPPYVPIPPGASPADHYLRSGIGRRLFPPLALGVGLMCWYEYIGRLCCFLLCANHAFWEPVLSLSSQLVFRRGAVPPRSFVRDFMRHTHHSAFHTFHNVVCGGAHLVDECIAALGRAGHKIHILHGDRDPVCPVDRSRLLKKTYSHIVVKEIADANHASVLVGREREGAHELEAMMRAGEAALVASQSANH